MGVGGVSVGRSWAGPFVGLLLALPACGGGGPYDTGALTAGLHAPDAGSAGEWSAPFPLPAIAIHAGLLPDERVLLWGTGHAAPTLFDPRDGSLAEGPMLETELF